MKWMEHRNDVSGILTPVINGQRFFMDAATREAFKMEAETGEINVVAVGKYIFSATAFDRAKKILLESSGQKEGWLIVDEVGPLELKGEGFDDVLKEILSTGSSFDRENSKLKIILVVRESLVAEVIKHYEIVNYANWEIPNEI